MIDWGSLGAALAVVTGPEVLLWTLVGTLVGFVFGASPGLTATTGVAIATPLTFGASFEASMALLLGTYCAGYFAGSIPAILINTPGAPGNAPTALAGYRLARAGKADFAIGLAVLGSAAGGVLSLVVLMLAAPTLSAVALRFTSVEYFSLGLFGLICVAAVSGGSLVKGIAAAALGFLLSTIGIDAVGGITRFTFGLPDLQAGVPLIPALIAFFAVAEMLAQAAESRRAQPVPRQPAAPVGRVVGTLARNWALVLRSAALGTGIGVLPGTGPTIASWVAYGQAGAGSVEESPDAPLDAAGEARAARGVIASEVANNAVTGGALVPLLTLGIPGDTVTAVLVGALLIQGIDPGPFFIVQHPDLFAQILLILGLSAAMIVALGLAARRMMPLVLRIPARIMLPVIGVLCATGAFAINNTPFEVGLVAILGVAGYVLLRFGFPMAPIVIGLVLGPIIEVNLRNGLTANDGAWSAFVTRPISGTILAAILATLGWAAWRRRRAGVA